MDGLIFAGHRHHYFPLSRMTSALSHFHDANVRIFHSEWSFSHSDYKIIWAPLSQERPHDSRNRASNRPNWCVQTLHFFSQNTFHGVWMTLTPRLMPLLLSKHARLRVAHLSLWSEVTVFQWIVLLCVSPVWSSSPHVTAANQSPTHPRSKDLMSSRVIMPSLVREGTLIYVLMQ